jgi:hypothetical protein
VLSTLAFHRPDGATHPPPVVPAAAVVVAVGAGVLVGVGGVFGLAAVVGGVVVVAVAARPFLGGAALLAVTPLVVGIDRGAVLPVLRPNEALLGLVILALVLRGVHHVATGRPIRVVMGGVEWSLVATAVAASVLPLLWMAGRGRVISSDDLFYASALWKYLALFVVIRLTVRTEAQVRTALWVSLWAGAIVGLVAVAQSLGAPVVQPLLDRFYSPGDLEGIVAGRGTSTLSSSIAVGDVMAFLLAVVVAFAARADRHRVLLLALGGVFVLGAVGSGQMSGVIALGVAAVVASALTGTFRRFVVVAVPLSAIVGLALWPIIERRLDGIDQGSGLPQSWVARIENLQEFFWPVLRSDWNWVLGVRPSARVEAPEVWRDWVFIESGHTWLLWNGGVPLLVAFLVFLVLALRAVLPRARRADAVGVAATGSAAALVVLAVLMLFDPHLTMRGTADLHFALLALALAGGAAAGRAGAETHEGTSSVPGRRPKGVMR